MCVLAANISISLTTSEMLSSRLYIAISDVGYHSVLAICRRNTFLLEDATVTNLWRKSTVDTINPEQFHNHTVCPIEYCALEQNHCILINHQLSVNF